MNKQEYRILHGYICQISGMPQKCEHCQSTTKKCEWASINHTYTMDPKDWIRLCHACHMRFDRKTPEFCKCGNKHRLLGMCQNCYQQTEHHKSYMKIYNKKYRQTHKEKCRKFNKEYQKAEKFKQYMKKYRSTEKRQKYMKEYQLKRKLNL